MYWLIEPTCYDSMCYDSMCYDFSICDNYTDQKIVCNHLSLITQIIAIEIIVVIFQLT